MIPACYKPYPTSFKLTQVVFCSFQSVPTITTSCSVSHNHCHFTNYISSNWQLLGLICSFLVFVCFSKLCNIYLSKIKQHLRLMLYKTFKLKLTKAQFQLLYLSCSTPNINFSRYSNACADYS